MKMLKQERQQLPKDFAIFLTTVKEPSFILEKIVRKKTFFPFFLGSSLEISQGKKTVRLMETQPQMP